MATQIDEAQLFQQIEQEIAREEQQHQRATLDKEIARRVQNSIAQALAEEHKAEREHERLQRPMDQQQVLGVSIRGSRKVFQDAYPLVFIALPEDIVEILEEAFDSFDLASLSRNCSCLVKSLSGAPREALQEGVGRWNEYKSARSKNKKSSGAHSASADPKVDVPILLEIVGAGLRVEKMELVLCAWALEYQRTKELHTLCVGADK